jgi:NAD-dependent deacetylase
MIDTFEDTLKRAKKVVFLTGAGISQESGISIFRGTDGLWKKYDPIKLGSAQAFRDNPKLVWSWYNDRRRENNGCKTKRGTSGHSKSAEPQQSLSSYSEYRWLTSDGREQRGD